MLNFFYDVRKVLALLCRRGSSSVFITVLEQIGMCDDLRIFEGPSTGRRPVFRSSNLSSGLLKVVGKMVGHCYVPDGWTRLSISIQGMLLLSV